jgi:hypothetical protein
MNVMVIGLGYSDCLYRWLYALLLAMDANFKQKARARPNDNRDIQLGAGWGCVVDSEEYSELIKARQHEDEVREPSRLIAHIKSGLIVHRSPTVWALRQYGTRTIRNLRVSVQQELGLSYALGMNFFDPMG